MDNPTTSNARRAILLFAALVLVAGGLVLLRWHEMPVGAATDDAYYVEMARSVAEGRGPVIHLHDQSGPWPADVFPPGLPLLLAPVARLAPDSIEPMKLVPLLAWLALIPLCWRWPSGGAPPWRRMALAVLVVANPWTVAYAARIVSDLPYTALSLGALIAYRGWTERPDRWRFLLLILLLVMAVTVRTVGWALPAALMLHLVQARRWGRALTLVTACGLPLGAIHLWAAPLGAGLFSGGYAAQVLQSAGQSRVDLVLGNFFGYLAEIPALLLPVFGEPTRALARLAGLQAVYGPLLMVLGAGLLVLVGFGWRGGRTHGGPNPAVLYAVLYGLALINFAGWPTGIQTRLLLPVLPLLVDGMLGFFEHPKVKVRRAPALIPVALLLLLAALFHNGYRVARPPVEDQFDPQLGSTWLKENSGPGETVLVRMPLKQHLHLDRPTVGFGVLTGEALDARVERFDVRWIVLGPEPMTGESEEGIRTETLAALVAARPEVFFLARTDPSGRFRIFRVVSPTPVRTSP